MIKQEWDIVVKCEQCQKEVFKLPLTLEFDERPEDEDRIDWKILGYINEMWKWCPHCGWMITKWHNLDSKRTSHEEIVVSGGNLEEEKWKCEIVFESKYDDEVIGLKKKGKE